MDEIVIFKKLSAKGNVWYQLVKTEVIGGKILKLTTSLFENQVDDLVKTGIKLVDLVK